MTTGPEGPYASAVTTRAQAVLDEALRLPERARARVAVELLASIDGAPDSDAEAVWAKEIERRAHRALAGKSVGRDWATVRDQLRKSSRRR